MTADNGTYLTREEMLSFQDVRAEDVKVTAWGGRMTRVRAMDARELAWWRGALMAFAGKLDSEQAANTAMVAGSFALRIKVVIMCTVDDSGAAIFTDKDEAKLGSKSGEAIDQLFAVISRLSGLTPREETEAVQAAEGFSEGTPASV